MNVLAILISFGLGVLFGLWWKGIIIDRHRRMHEYWVEIGAVGENEDYDWPGLQPLGFAMSAAVLLTIIFCFA